MDLTGATSAPLMDFRADRLRVIVHEDRARIGRAAAAEVGQIIADRLSVAEFVRVIFAAAPSQDEFLAALIAHRGIDWSRVVGFQMDEYLGIDADHRGSTRRYLQEHLFRWSGIVPERLHLIDASPTSGPSSVALGYESLVRQAPIDLVCAGIGENGHLAFNDPHSADFIDPAWVKVVRLDAMSREQQVVDGNFDSIDDVPQHAYSLTIPALMASSRVSVVVTGPRKSTAILGAVRGPISEACPASILRTHPDATLHLDRESARLLV